MEAGGGSVSFNIHSLQPNFVAVDESTIGPGQQGDAAYFAQMFSRVLRYNVDTKKWLFWNGHYWNDGANEDVVEFVRYMNDARVKEAQKQLSGAKKKLATAQMNEADQAMIEKLERDKTLRSSHFKNLVNCCHSNYISGIIRLAQSFPVLKTHMNEWDNNPFLLATMNGVIDLTNGTFRVGQQSDMLSHGIPVKYDAASKCPRFEKFISEVLEGPEEAQAMHTYLGYCITGTVEAQVIAFFTGEGSNGKSKLLDTMSEILGKEPSGFAWTMSTASLSDKSRDNIPADIASLAGKRVAIASETGEGRVIDAVKLKQLSGEETLNARLLYSNPTNFRARMKIILNVNHLPEAKDTSNGYWRRCMIWRFPKNFELPDSGKDPRLMEKLRAEYPGILNWLVTGAVRWHKKGLIQTARQKELTEHYREDNDPIQPFIEEVLELGEEKDCAISISRLRELTAAWNKGEKKFTDEALIKRLEKLGAERKARGHDRTRHWVRIKERGLVVLNDTLSVTR